MQTKNFCCGIKSSNVGQIRVQQKGHSEKQDIKIYGVAREASLDVKFCRMSLNPGADKKMI